MDDKAYRLLKRTSCIKRLISMKLVSIINSSCTNTSCYEIFILNFQKIITKWQFISYFDIIAMLNFKQLYFIPIMTIFNWKEMGLWRSKKNSGSQQLSRNWKSQQAPRLWKRLDVWAAGPQKVSRWLESAGSHIRQCACYNHYIQKDCNGAVF